jgi:hypothetical protein
VAARNAANTADVTLLKLDSTNNLSMLPVAGGGSLALGAGTSETQGSYDLLHLRSVDGSSTQVFLDSYGSTGVLNGRGAQGTFASPSPSTLNQQLLALNVKGFASGGVGFGGPVSGQFAFKVAESSGFSGTAMGTYATFSTTPIGTITLTEAFRVQANGGLQISNNWSAAPVADDHVGGSRASVILSVHGNKFVIACNNAGTETFIAIPLDGSTTTWTQTTTAP